MDWNGESYWESPDKGLDDRSQFFYRNIRTAGTGGSVGNQGFLPMVPSLDARDPPLDSLHRRAPRLEDASGKDIANTTHHNGNATLDIPAQRAGTTPSILLQIN
ncbi:hypothetical protein PQX77_000374 [Marasmius sp. AFHP31]|nr:hypothetical protein PQX77_000374 [Marasmius sp. AFHP31]